MKHTYITKENLGRKVVCDACGVDYTDSPVSGGLIFDMGQGFLLVGNEQIQGCGGDWAYCPKCASEAIIRMEQCDESRYIRGRCPPEMSFANWVRQWRGGEGWITTTEKK